MHFNTKGHSLQQYLHYGIKRLFGWLKSHYNRSELVALVSAYANKAQNDYLTYHIRPGSPSRKNVFADPASAEYEKIGVVVQGPIISEDSFTLETLTYYKTIWPEVQIVLSTWIDSNHSIIEKTKALGVEVLLSEKPKFPGRYNINYQVVSTRRGLEKLKEMGCTYAMKTRSDQRIYAHSCLPALVNALEVFPAKNTPAKGRIVVSGLNSYKYRPYSLSDMFQFGFLDDMLAFWSRASEVNPFAPISNGESIEKQLARGFPEQILATEYLKKMSIYKGESISDYWRSVADSFLVFDPSSLDQFWLKYDRSVEYRNRFYSRRLNEVFSFFDWLVLAFTDKHFAPDLTKIQEKTIDMKISKEDFSI